MKKLILISAIAFISCSQNKTEAVQVNTDSLIGVDSLQKTSDTTEKQIDNLADSARAMMEKAGDKADKKN